MKKTIVTAAALATALASLASPVMAAPPRHRAATESTGPYVQNQSWAQRGDTVTFGNRVVGTDPDQNIRTQLLHDPNPSEY